MPRPVVRGAGHGSPQAMALKISPASGWSPAQAQSRKWASGRHHTARPVRTAHSRTDDGNPMLEAATGPMLRARSALRQEMAGLERGVRQFAQEDPVCRRMMSMPGVGAVVALTYRSAVDDPRRFTSSKKVGPWVTVAGHIGMPIAKAKRSVRAPVLAAALASKPWGNSVSFCAKGACRLKYRPRWYFGPEKNPKPFGSLDLPPRVTDICSGSRRGHRPGWQH